MDKHICNEVIKFTKVSNSIIDIQIKEEKNLIYVFIMFSDFKVVLIYLLSKYMWYKFLFYFLPHRHLYEEMDNGDDVLPIQFGFIAKLHLDQASYPSRCSYI